jgi:hypothetical protein
MRRDSVSILLAVLLLLNVNAWSAETVKAPRGWEDTVVGNTRVVSNGNTTITIGPWESLQGQSAQQWLTKQAHIPPASGELISVEAVKEDTVPGSYSVIRKAKFGKQTGTSVLYLCPGLDGHARLFSMDVHDGGFFELLKGAVFGENVCKKERKGSGPLVSDIAAPVQRDDSDSGDASSGASDTASQTIVSTVQDLDISDSELRIKNGLIPANQRPVSASLYSYSRWSGFPAMLIFEVGMAVAFDNGVEIACLEWDPAETVDLNKLANTEDCTLPEDDDKSKIFPFKAGERLTLSYGNVSASGFDGLEGSASSVSGRGLQLNKAGEIILDRWRASHLSAAAARARSTATNKSGVTGRYYLDGYTITILTNKGEILNGFIGYSVDDSNKIDALFLNGKHYWDRSKY